METCSPVEAITSSSRGSASGLSSFARPSRRLVSPDMAEGTTTSWWPSFTNRCTRRATSRMRSGLPMEVPPYFWTMRDTGGESGKAAILAWSTSPERIMTSLRSRAVRLIALACGLVATLFAWFQVGQQADREAGAQFASRANFAVGVLERRIGRYLDILYGLQAF